jgi:hypothetical protein
VKSVCIGFPFYASFYADDLKYVKERLCPCILLHVSSLKLLEILKKLWWGFYT